MNLNRLFIGFLVLAGFLSCDNEINIAADFANIPVVFALVDAGEEFNYFRIERAFIDENISPEILAQNPDSVFYGDNVRASVTNMTNGQTAVLTRVNLDDEGFEREDGPFVTSPNIGYRLEVAQLALGVNDILNFQLIGSDDLMLTEATATVVGEHTIGSQPVNPIRFRHDRELTLTLRSDEQAAVFYDLRLTFNYSEESVNNPGENVNRSIEWVVESELPRRTSSAGGFQTQTTFRIDDGAEFYRFVAANIEEDPNITRRFLGIDLRYDAGGEDLFSFINIGQANTGITSGQIIPSFTNLTNDAVGVFSSRISTFNEESYGLDTEARDSLREGSITGPLNFN